MAALDGVLTPEGLAGIQATAGNRATVQAVRNASVVQRSLDGAQAAAIAERLHAAMEGWGTDEEAVYGALASRTPDDIDEIKDAYFIAYDHSLLEDINDEFSGDELAKALHLLEGRAAPGPDATPQEARASAGSSARAIAEQLRDAMAGWGTEEDQIYNALTGRTADEIDEIRRQYHDLTGHSLDRDIRDEMSGDELQQALDLINSGNSGTFRNEFSENLTEGLYAVGEGIWDWEIVDGKFLVHIEIDFRPQRGVSYDVGRWQRQIASVWNRFAVVADNATETPVEFDLREQRGAEHVVKVVPNATQGSYGSPDRADAGKWYPVMRDTTAPHEFGHLIGLADEYERTAEDFKAVTNAEVPETANESTSTSREIADALHTALYDRERDQRAPAATGVLEGVGLMKGGSAVQGTFAQQVMQSYDSAYDTPLLEAIRDRCPEGTAWQLIYTFSLQSDTIMGNMSDHTHPVAPRHLRPVLDVLRGRYPDKSWSLKPLR